MDWNELTTLARTKAKEHPPEYLERLEKEIYEIIKQGAGMYWIDNKEANEKWDTNPNGLILPYLLGMTPVDPFKGNTIFIEAQDGTEMSAVIIELENGKKIVVSENTLIKTDKGYIKASELKEGVEIA